MYEEETILGVDIIGCDEGSDGRSCISHEVCGKFVQVGDILVLRWEVIPIGDDIEEVIKAHVIRDGSQECHIGYLPRHLLRQKERYKNKMAVVIEDLRLSTNFQRRRRSERNKGILYCNMLDAIEEQFRQ
jgi:hypothetical protein